MLLTSLLLPLLPYSLRGREYRYIGSFSSEIAGTWSKGFKVVTVEYALNVLLAIDLL